MATTNQPGIVNSWSLLAFAKSHGQMKVTAPMTHVNSETGEEFTATSCAFVHPTEKDDQGRAAVCFVGFSRNLGELSAKEIASKQNELQVVEMQNGRYVLCEQGNSSWEDVALNIG
jgi:hypothetical protein